MLASVMKTTVAVAAVVAPVVALGQDSAPPQPMIKGTPVWIGFLFMIILLTIVLGVSLMPSKRGHQD